MEMLIFGGGGSVWGFKTDIYRYRQVKSLHEVHKL